MLVLPEETRTLVENWARESYPDEGCGVLVGRPGAAGGTVVRATRSRNLDRQRARDRYQLDPLALLEADDAARRDGLDVIGIWHSHPDHPAFPSETDRADAWEGWSYVIVSVSAGAVPDLRSFRLEGGRFVEEDVKS